MHNKCFKMNQINEIYYLVKWAFHLLDTAFYFFDEEGNTVVSSFMKDEEVFIKNNEYHLSSKNVLNFNNTTNNHFLSKELINQVKWIIQKGTEFTNNCTVDASIPDKFLDSFISFVYVNELNYFRQLKNNQSNTVFVLYSGVDDCLDANSIRGIYTDTHLLFNDYQILKQKILEESYLKCYVDVYSINNRNSVQHYEASQFFQIYFNKEVFLWKK